MWNRDNHTTRNNTPASRRALGQPDESDTSQPNGGARPARESRLDGRGSGPPGQPSPPRRSTATNPVHQEGLQIQRTPRGLPAPASSPLDQRNTLRRQQPHTAKATSASITARVLVAASAPVEDTSNLQARYSELNKKYIQIVEQELEPMLGSTLSSDRAGILEKKLEELSKEISTLAQNPQLSSQDREELDQRVKVGIPGYKLLLGIEASSSEPSSDHHQRAAQHTQAGVADHNLSRQSQMRRTNSLAQDSAILEMGAKVSQEFTAFHSQYKKFTAAVAGGLPADLQTLRHLGAESVTLMESARSIESEIKTYVVDSEDKARKLSVIAVARSTMTIFQQQIGGSISEHEGRL